MIEEASSAYRGVASAWAQGPSRMYDRLAQEIVAAYPAPLAGQHVLDIGAGTGAVSRALIRRGARATGVDLSPDMVEHMQADGLDAVTGDLCALPFSNASFDGGIAAFSISHVERPISALREMRRVVHDGGTVLVAVFAARPANASKEVVDGVAEHFGFVRPQWYEWFKNEVEPLTNTPEKLRVCAQHAGLADIVIHERVIDTGVATAQDIVSARLGMAYLAPFVESLPPSKRDELTAASVAAVARDPQPLRPVVLLLCSRARG